ncbi:MAG: 50S ribosomal protein L10 [Acidobacteria bacterium]|nr:50S ribosomal protein L10 [Acidobacteriota bacterium]
MDKLEKQQVVEQLNKAFKENSSVMLVNFTGINVPDATELRQKIAEAGSRYQVVKNTLALRAASQTSVDQLRDYFDGPTAIAYTSGDAVTLAKTLVQFAKAHPSLTLKAGVLNGTLISGKQVEELAAMPSRAELIAKLLFLLNSPLSRLMGALQAPLRNLGWALKQIGDQKG